jgi:hypothetical protein
MTPLPSPLVCALASTDGPCAGGVEPRRPLVGAPVFPCDGHASAIAELMPGIVPALRALARPTAAAPAAD